MITNISTDGLYDETYKKIIDEMMALREKQLHHTYELNKLGTNSTLYSIAESVMSPFYNGKLRRYSRFFLRKLAQYLKKRNKILVSNVVDVVWTSKIIEKSSSPYPVRRVEYPWAILNAQLDHPMKILDVGSGLSLLPVYLAKKGHSVVSLDNDKILMERVLPKLASFVGADVDYRIGDATKLDFDDNSFDRVFCISVLEHLEEEVIDGKHVNYRKKNLDVKAIEEMLRVLKPNGRLILTFDWDENPENLRSYTIDDICNRVLKKYSDFLVENKKPIIEWDTLRKEHIKAWKAFPPYNYVYDGWSVGSVLVKKKSL